MGMARLDGEVLGTLSTGACRRLQSEIVVHCGAGLSALDRI
jgi:hypothetical protein